MKKLIIIAVILTIIIITLLYDPTISIFTIGISLILFLTIKVPIWILKSKWYKRRNKRKEINTIKNEILKMKFIGSGMKFLEFHTKQYELNIKLRKLTNEYNKV